MKPLLPATLLFLVALALPTLAAPNRLAREASPYLRQHQSNPVDWHPWGEAAFAKARTEGKPIFLSSGYSTCHWCHVMARESFSSPAIAKLLNDSFISIKLDREERPDVDRLYMTFVEATTGSGGWPLNVFLTPELKPFYGGTYFPPQDRGGHPGFATVLEQVATAWKNERPRLTGQGDAVLAALKTRAALPPASTGLPSPEPLRLAATRLAASYDAAWGGFSDAPKFPLPSRLRALLRVETHFPASAEGKASREQALLTLQKMAAGGLYDALGGGFHRYSVDAEWRVPHFEKMLYDQALLTVAYLEAYQLTADPAFATTASDTLAYTRTRLGHPGGGFYAAEDAESPLSEVPDQKAEGAFYTWAQAEVEALLGPEAAPLFIEAYGITPVGEPGFGGRSILHRATPTATLANAHRLSPQEVEASLAQSRARLLAQRAQRPPPHRDEKIITAWNGLAISAFARAAHPLREPSHLATAERAARFAKEKLWHGGRLLRSWHGDTPGPQGVAQDYAYLIQGLLDLYEAGGNTGWLQWAVELQEVQDTLFLDAKHGGYTSSTAGELLLDLRETHDGGEPAPSSVAALNLLRLGRLLGSEAHTERGNSTLRAFGAPLAYSPESLTQLLLALSFAHSAPVEIVLAGPAEARAPYEHLIASRFLPHATVRHADGGPGQAWLTRHLPYLEGLAPPTGHAAAAYLCEANACRPPATTPEALARQLGKPHGKPGG